MNAGVEIIYALLLGVPMSILLFGFCWYGYRVYRTLLPAMDAKWAYRFKKYRIEIEKRGIDFVEMMDEFNEATAIFPPKKGKYKGVLNEIDESIEGELDEEPVKKSKAK